MVPSHSYIELRSRQKAKKLLQFLLRMFVSSSFAWDIVLNICQLSPIAKPLADRKLNKRVSKLIKKGVYPSLYLEDYGDPDVISYQVTTNKTRGQRDRKSRQERRERACPRVLSCNVVLTICLLSASLSSPRISLPWTSYLTCPSLPKTHPYLTSLLRRRKNLAVTARPDDLQAVSLFLSTHFIGRRREPEIQRKRTKKICKRSIANALKR